LAILREAPGSPALATLRETIDVWSAVVESAESAASSPIESVMRARLSSARDFTPGRRIAPAAK
jgi:hypothetical protein